MKKSRWVLTLAAGAVVAGLGVGTVAYVNSSGFAAQSPAFPSTMSWIPAGATVMGHVDLTSVLASPFREAWEQHLRERDTGELEEFRKATGLDLPGDVQRLSFALVTNGDFGNDRDESGPANAPPSAESWGISIQGELDPDVSIRKLEQSGDIERDEYEGATIYYPRPIPAEVDAETPGTHDEVAVAFVNEDTVVVGDRDYVRLMLDAGQGRAESALPALERSWGGDAFLEDTFWIAAAPENGFGGMLPLGSELPPLRSVALSGRLEADVALRARGLAADLDSARKLAEVVRGFVALGGLHQAGNPEVGGILDSIQIEQYENTVEISLNVPYETLERLSQRAERPPADRN